MSSAIEQEFDKVYGLVFKDGNETRQRFLSKVVEKVNKTSDDDWEELTADAQRWFNTAVKAWDVEKPVPDFPDAEPEPESDEASDEEGQDADAADADRSDDGEESEDDMAAARKKKRGAAKKRAPAKKTVAKKRVVHAASNGKLAQSGGSFLKRAMLKDMSMSKDDIAKMLKKQGFPLSPVRIDIVRSDFRHTIRLLQEDGLLKNKYDI